MLQYSKASSSEYKDRHLDLDNKRSSFKRSGSENLKQEQNWKQEQSNKEQHQRRDWRQEGGRGFLNNPDSAGEELPGAVTTTRSGKLVEGATLHKRGGALERQDKSRDRPVMSSGEHSRSSTLESRSDYRPSGGERRDPSGRRGQNDRPRFSESSTDMDGEWLNWQESFDKLNIDLNKELYKNTKGPLLENGRWKDAGKEPEFRREGRQPPVFRSFREQGSSSRSFGGKSGQGTEHSKDTKRHISKQQSSFGTFKGSDVRRNVDERERQQVRGYEHLQRQAAPQIQKVSQRAYSSDSEDPESWLERQRKKLSTSRTLHTKPGQVEHQVLTDFTHSQSNLATSPGGTWVRIDENNNTSYPSKDSKGDVSMVWDKSGSLDTRGRSNMRGSSAHRSFSFTTGGDAGRYQSLPRGVRVDSGTLRSEPSREKIHQYMYDDEHSRRTARTNEHGVSLGGGSHWQGGTASHLSRKAQSTAALNDQPAERSFYKAYNLRSSSKSRDKSRDNQRTHDDTQITLQPIGIQYLESHQPNSRTATLDRRFGTLERSATLDRNATLGGYPASASSTFQRDQRYASLGPSSRESRRDEDVNSSRQRSLSRDRSFAAKPQSFTIRPGFYTAQPEPLLDSTSSRVHSLGSHDNHPGYNGSQHASRDKSTERYTFGKQPGEGSYPGVTLERSSHYQTSESAHKSAPLKFGSDLQLRGSEASAINKPFAGSSEIRRPIPISPNLSGYRYQNGVTSRSMNAGINERNDVQVEQAWPAGRRGGPSGGLDTPEGAIRSYLEAQESVMTRELATSGRQNGNQMNTITRAESLKNSANKAENLPSQHGSQYPERIDYRDQGPYQVSHQEIWSYEDRSQIHPEGFSNNVRQPHPQQQWSQTEVNQGSSTMPRNQPFGQQLNSQQQQHQYTQLTQSQGQQQPGNNFVQQPGYVGVQQPRPMTAQQPGYIVAQPTGFITAQQASRFTAQQADLVTAQQPGYITAQQGGPITAQQPRYVTAQQGGPITAQQAGHVTAQQSVYVGAQPHMQHQPAYASTDDEPQYSFVNKDGTLRKDDQQQKVIVSPSTSLQTTSNKGVDFPQENYMHTRQKSTTQTSSAAPPGYKLGGHHRDAIMADLEPFLREFGDDSTTEIIRPQVIQQRQTTTVQPRFPTAQVRFSEDQPSATVRPQPVTIQTSSVSRPQHARVVEPPQPLRVEVSSDKKQANLDQPQPGSQNNDYQEPTAYKRPINETSVTTKINGTSSVAGPGWQSQGLNHHTNGPFKERNSQSFTSRSDVNQSAGTSHQQEITQRIPVNSYSQGTVNQPQERHTFGNQTQNGYSMSTTNQPQQGYSMGTVTQPLQRYSIGTVTQPQQGYSIGTVTHPRHGHSISTITQPAEAVFISSQGYAQGQQQPQEIQPRTESTLRLVQPCGDPGFQRYDPDGGAPQAGQGGGQSLPRNVPGSAPERYYSHPQTSVYQHPPVGLQKPGMMNGEGFRMSEESFSRNPASNSSIDSPHSLDLDTRMRSGAVYRSSSPNTHSSPSVSVDRSSGGSLASSRDGAELGGGAYSVKFIRDISSQWYRPQMAREQIVATLRSMAPGSFIVRDSSSYPGSYALAVKVAELPANIQAKGDSSEDLVRHFLIEPTPKGVRLKGYKSEPVFGSLAALVYQHTLTPIALPCRLILPPIATANHDEVHVTSSINQMQAAEGATSTVLYLLTQDTETLTGPEAVERTASRALGSAPAQTTVVQLSVSADGVTVTDNKRKLFFRRHYPLRSITYCGADGNQRRWTETDTNSGRHIDGRIFGFVSRKLHNPSSNECHLFAEIDMTSQSKSGAISICDVMKRSIQHHVTGAIVK